MATAGSKVWEKLKRKWGKNKTRVETVPLERDRNDNTGKI
jgi:hypothetical protein